MYEEYWGLSGNPFRNVLDARFFYRGSQYDEALARLGFLVDNNMRGGLLLGPAGCGKSLVLQVFGHEIIRSRHRWAVVRSPAFDSREILYELCEQLGVTPSPSASRTALWRALQSLIRENRYQSIHTILAIDEAQLLPDEATLADVLLLMRLDDDPGARLTVLMAGHPVFLERLQAEESYWQSFDLGLNIGPLDAAETRTYVEHRLAVAGRRDETFQEATFAAIHQFSRGVPKQINRICDLSLVEACGQQLRQVSVEVVNSVGEDLSNPSTAATVVQHA